MRDSHMGGIGGPKIGGGLELLLQPDCAACERTAAVTMSAVHLSEPSVPRSPSILAPFRDVVCLCGDCEGGRTSQRLPLWFDSVASILW